jgi:short-chain fatty acids transporter
MNWVDRLARAMERVVPDAITTSILLMVLMFSLSLMVGTDVGTTMDAYYRGLWNLLTFTMQMTLILVLSLLERRRRFVERSRLCPDCRGRVCRWSWPPC